MLLNVIRGFRPGISFSIHYVTGLSATSPAQQQRRLRMRWMNWSMSWWNVPQESDGDGA